jgi:hypothetical protein
MNCLSVCTFVYTPIDEEIYFRMREQQKQPRPTRYFDYNQPTGRCKVCSTLSGWHCYDCGSDFCQNHFEHHKDNHFCEKN